MKKITYLLVLLLCGCSLQFDPFKKSEGENNQKIGQLVQAVNALNEFVVKLDGRVKNLEPQPKK